MHVSIFIFETVIAPIRESRYPPVKCCLPILSNDKMTKSINGLSSSSQHSCKYIEVVLFFSSDVVLVAESRTMPPRKSVVGHHDRKAAGQTLKTMHTDEQLSLNNIERTDSGRYVASPMPSPRASPRASPAPSRDNTPPGGTPRGVTFEGHGKVKFGGVSTLPVPRAGGAGKVKVLYGTRIFCPTYLPITTCTRRQQPSPVVHIVNTPHTPYEIFFLHDYYTEVRFLLLCHFCSIRSWGGNWEWV